MTLPVAAGCDITGPSGFVLVLLGTAGCDVTLTGPSEFVLVRLGTAALLQPAALQDVTSRVSLSGRMGMAVQQPAQPHSSTDHSRVNNSLCRNISLSLSLGNTIQL